MLNGALLSIVEEAATSILTLMEGIEEIEFRTSRLTRHEVRRQLLVIAGIAAQLPPDARAQMPETDWAEWVALGRGLEVDGKSDDETLWFGIRALTPATLMWLRVYRQNSPELFSFTA